MALAHRFPNRDQPILAGARETASAGTATGRTKIDRGDFSFPVICNVTDGDQSILSDFEISVLDADGKEVWTHRQYDFPDPMALITVGSVNGRSVKVQLNGKGSLKLAEVLVECAETVQDHDANSE